MRNFKLSVSSYYFNNLWIKKFPQIKPLFKCIEKNDDKNILNIVLIFAFVSDNLRSPTKGLVRE